MPRYGGSLAFEAAMNESPYHAQASIIVLASSLLVIIINPLFPCWFQRSTAAHGADRAAAIQNEHQLSQILSHTLSSLLRLAVTILPFINNLPQIRIQQFQSIILQLRHCRINTRPGIESPCNGAGNVRQGITVTAKRYSRSQSILETDRFKKCCDCLWHSTLAGFIEGIPGSDFIYRSGKRVEVLIDVLAYAILAFAGAS